MKSRLTARNLLLACLVLLTVSVLFIAYGVYLLGHAAQEYMPMVQSYTCGAFRRDVEMPDGNKGRAVAVATIAFGRADTTAEATATRLERDGVLPAVAKVYQLCETQLETPVTNVLVGQVTGVSASSVVISTTQSVSTSQSAGAAQ